ncbi:MAG: glycoside hydrolase family 3 protein [bacterium]
MISITCLADGELIQPAIEKKIDQLLSGMTLEQKVGQMVQGEIKHVSPADVRRYGLGSILNGGGSFPGGDRNATPADWVALADRYFLASTDTSKGNAGIPIIWGTDAVHGHNNVIGATLFPHNIGLGAADDADLLRRIGEVTAKEVAATGLDWIFAPTVAVVKDNRWGRTYEGYSNRPDIVANYADNVVEGIQSTGMIATAKHFIGDGGTLRGIDQGDTMLSLDRLLEQHGQGYVEAIDAGVLTVMASFNSWNGSKVHGNKTLLTDVLKNDMGFDGFVVSDWNGIGQVDGCSNASCPQAINAGVDMIMAPEDWKALIHNIVDQVHSGEISRARIDDAVRRILRVKFISGVMDAPQPSKRDFAKTPELVGSDAHRAVAREAVRKSLVLLKNNDSLLPLNPAQHILVTGSAADDIGRQSGGWTISWQGTGNQNSDFPGGSSIFQGIKEVVSQAGGRVTLSEKMPADDRPDVAIVVFGETPYAEGQGDLMTLDLDKAHDKDIRRLQALHAEGIPVVAVFITGRPMWVNNQINNSDAFVAAWLPGSEGAGVADVLFADASGQPRYDFEGRLSFDWPNKELNAEDFTLPVDKTLFAYGYGLDYQSPAENLAALDEQPVGFQKSIDVTVFKRGTHQPWKLYLGDNSDWFREVVDSTAESATGAVSITAKDFRVQEDSRQITWHGKRNSPAQVYWQSEEPLDLSQLKDADGALSVVFRLDRRLRGDAELRMDCGWPCKASFDFGDILKYVPENQWQRLSVPLSCFVESELDIEKVNTPLLLSVDGSLQLTIAEVAVLESPPQDSIIDCAEGTGLAGK